MASRPVCVNGGGDKIPKVMIDEPISAAMRGRYSAPGCQTEQRLELGKNVSNCLTSVAKDSLIVEPAALTPRRTEYGKAMRKEYDSGKLKISRHKMTELKPRDNGQSNTITTVPKENMLLEPQPKTRLRIRKLTEREVFRLMDVDEEYIDKMLSSGVSRSRLYFAAGNSIVVSCMEHIFEELLFGDTEGFAVDETGQMLLF